MVDGVRDRGTGTDPTGLAHALDTERIHDVVLALDQFDVGIRDVRVDGDRVFPQARAGPAPGARVRVVGLRQRLAEAPEHAAHQLAAGRLGVEYPAGSEGPGHAPHPDQPEFGAHGHLGELRPEGRHANSARPPGGLHAPDASAPGWKSRCSGSVYESEAVPAVITPSRTTTSTGWWPRRRGAGRRAAGQGRDRPARGRRVYWLNPEPRFRRGTGASAAPEYAELVEMHECRTVRRLSALVGRLLPV